MRTLTILGAVLSLALAASSASAAQLWAFDAASGFGGYDYAYTFDPDGAGYVAAAFPTGEFEGVWGAAYDAAASTLYISGTYETPYWFSSAIAIYQGGPGGLSLVSASAAGLEDIYWAAGIEYLNGSLYGIGMDAFGTGNNLFVRIDNPGTASQTATQIGADLGSAADMGTPFGLCSDGQGGMFASFRSSSGGDSHTDLYLIDVATGAPTLLRSWLDSELDPGSGAIESLEFTEGRLFGLMSSGDVFEIDTATYDLTHLLELPSSTWTALVAIPEPGTILLMLGGLVALLTRWRKA